MPKQINKRVLVLFFIFSFYSATNFCFAQEMEESVVVNFWDLNVYKQEPMLDTIYYPNKKIKGIGKILVYANGEKSQCYYGLWTFYYPSGIIESEGEYYVGSFKECKADTVAIKYYSFKRGKWVYSYENGLLKAEGAYDILAEYIPTTCAGLQKCFHHRMNKDWIVFDTKGKTMEVNQAIKNELEYIPEF